MAIGSFVDDFADDLGKVLQGVFSSQGDDALKAAKNILSNADDDVIEFIAKNKTKATGMQGAFKNVIKKDMGSGFFAPDNMYKYAGLEGAEGATSLFNSKDVYRGMLEANYAPSKVAKFDKFKPRGRDSIISQVAIPQAAIPTKTKDFAPRSESEKIFFEASEEKRQAISNQMDRDGYNSNLYSFDEYRNAQRETRAERKLNKKKEKAIYAEDIGNNKDIRNTAIKNDNSANLDYEEKKSGFSAAQDEWGEKQAELTQAQQTQMDQAAKKIDETEATKKAEEVKTEATKKAEEVKKLELIEKYKNSKTGDLKGDMYKDKSGFRRFGASKELDGAVEEIAEAGDDELKGKKTSKFKDTYKRLIGKDIEEEKLREIAGNKDKLADFKGEYLYGINDKNYTFSETMGYNKIPQKATGIAGTLWLVNKLSSSGGEQTNAQLYGQQPY